MNRFNLSRNNGQRTQAQASFNAVYSLSCECVFASSLYQSMSHAIALALRCFTVLPFTLRFVPLALLFTFFSSLNCSNYVFYLSFNLQCALHIAKSAVTQPKTSSLSSLMSFRWLPVAGFLMCIYASHILAVAVRLFNPSSVSDLGVYIEFISCNFYFSSLISGESGKRVTQRYTTQDNKAQFQTLLPILLHHPNSWFS